MARDCSDRLNDCCAHYRKVSNCVMNSDSMAACDSIQTVRLFLPFMAHPMPNEATA